MNKSRMLCLAALALCACASLPATAAPPDPGLSAVKDLSAVILELGTSLAQATAGFSDLSAAIAEANAKRELAPAAPTDMTVTELTAAEGRAEHIELALHERPCQTDSFRPVSYTAPAKPEPWRPLSA